MPLILSFHKPLFWASCYVIFIRSMFLPLITISVPICSSQIMECKKFPSFRDDLPACSMQFWIKDKRKAIKKNRSVNFHEITAVAQSSPFSIWEVFWLWYSAEISHGPRTPHVVWYCFVKVFRLPLVTTAGNLATLSVLMKKTPSWHVPICVFICVLSFSVKTRVKLAGRGSHVVTNAVISLSLANVGANYQVIFRWPCSLARVDIRLPWI